MLENYTHSGITEAVENQFVSDRHYQLDVDEDKVGKSCRDDPLG